MPDTDQWRPWERVGTPTVKVTADPSRVDVRFRIVPKDDGRWRAYFEDWLSQSGIQGGVDSSGIVGLGVLLQAPADSFEIAVGEADKAIEYANEQYRTIDLPARKSAAEARAAKKVQAAQRQRDLDERAAYLARPVPPLDL